MHVLMVTDAYPPMRTSCAVQMYDLGQAFIKEGHQVTIITPVSKLKKNIDILHKDGIRLVQVNAFETKDANYIFRTCGEFFNPFLIWHKLKKSPEFINCKYDGIIWYSPTIFWGPLIKRLKKLFHLKAYLILRDIFPDWALDLGLIKKGLIYKFFKAIERFQYQQADVIGVQSPNNLNYFNQRNLYLQAKVEVLWNWVGKSMEIPSSLDISKTTLAGRKIFVYAGNMGIAQGMDSLINIAKVLKDIEKIGFLFVGRGSEVKRLKSLAKSYALTNTLFFDEISPFEIPSLLNQCAVGMIALDARHNTHNIPGKFLAYLRAKLTVMAVGNSGNDLEELIERFHLGIYINASKQYLPEEIIKLVANERSSNQDLSRQHYFDRAIELFSPNIAAVQIQNRIF